MNEDQLPDLLSGFKNKDDGFTSPSPAYFTELAAKVVALEKQPSATKPTGARVRRIMPAIMAMAAALLLLVWFKPWAAAGNVTPAETELAVTESQLNDALASLSDEDIYDYINENISEFELETLTDE